jgi:hypothetical protein
VCMSMINLGDLPTLVHVLGAVFKRNWKKQKRESTGSRTRESLFKLNYKFTMRPSSNKDDLPWLTFPFESSSLTYPIQVRNSYKG